MDSEPIGPEASVVKRAQQLDHLAGGRYANGVTERYFAAPHVGQFARHGDDLCDGDVSLPGITETHRDIPSNRESTLNGPTNHWFEEPERVGHGSVEISLRETLGSTGKDRNLSNSRSQGAF
jgi:hypothetical protein